MLDYLVPTIFFYDGKTLLSIYALIAVRVKNKRRNALWHSYFASVLAITKTRHLKLSADNRGSS